MPFIWSDTGKHKRVLSRGFWSDVRFDRITLADVLGGDRRGRVEAGGS